MFKTCNNSGFHLTFKNGITVSVQWGEGCYATGVDSISTGVEARSAEVMIWDGNEHTLTFDTGDTLGYLSPDRVAVLIANAAAAVGLDDLRTRLQAAGFISIFQE